MIISGTNKTKCLGGQKNGKVNWKQIIRDA